MQYIITLFLTVFIFFSNVVDADSALLKQKKVQTFIHQMVKTHGFDRKQLNAILKEATYQPKIIEAMNRPYEKKNWDVYKALFLTPERVEKGLAFWKANQNTLEKAQQVFGVPAHIIVAILGVETMYGEHQGNYRVLDALTTLAFYYPKRAAFFRKELKEYLLLCREHNVPATEYVGSYAGAIGQPQFMPSSYRFYAVDFTGKGKRDLIHDNQDVIASVANYFRKHGWKMHEQVALPVQVHGKGHQAINTNARHADYDVKQLLKKAGIQTAEPLKKTPEKAGLIALNTKQGEEYWLAYPNFYVITRYNTSPQYALAVYLLSDHLKTQWHATH